MNRLVKGSLAVVLALTFLLRGVAAACAPAAPPGCCDEQQPPAPAGACAEMACCQVTPATAAPAVRPLESAALRPSLLVFTEPDAPAAVVEPESYRGPPGPRSEARAGRSPPILPG